MKILAEFSYEELFVLYELVSIDEMRRLLREENAYLLQDNKRLRKQNEVLGEKLKEYGQVKEVSVGG